MRPRLRSVHNSSTNKATTSQNDNDDEEKVHHHNITPPDRHWYDLFRPNVRIINNGLVARDHMANERTVLLWMRLASTFVLFGILFTQYHRMDMQTDPDTVEDDLKERQQTIRRISRPIGGLCVMLGAVALILGSYRYIHVQVLLRKDQFPATRLVLLAVIFVTIVILVLVFALDIKVTAENPVI